MLGPGSTVGFLLEELFFPQGKGIQTYPAVPKRVRFFLAQHGAALTEDFSSAALADAAMDLDFRPAAAAV